MRGLPLLVLAGWLGGCGDELRAPTGVELGERLFRAGPHLGGSKQNELVCATCHGTTKDGDRAGGTVFVGGSLHDVMARRGWWNGELSSSLQAVNACLTFFMKGDARGVPGDSPEMRALFEYLASLSPSPAASLEARRFSLPPQVRTVIPAGDRGRGAQVFSQACAPCHGAYGTGEGRVEPALTPWFPDAFRSYCSVFAEPKVPLALVVQEKVRHGQFFGAGGSMPPFAEELLSDAEIGDLLAFVELPDCGDGR